MSQKIGQGQVSVGRNQIIEDRSEGEWEIMKKSKTKRQIVRFLLCYIKKEVKQISGREYWWV